MTKTMFLHGQKGAGKTLFVEWLASELALPIYYLDLRAPYLDDGTLRDAITGRRVKHNPPVLFHIDEFQSMMEAWPVSTSIRNSNMTPTKVTIQGLQSVLEGIGTPRQSIFIITSSRDLPQLEDMTEDGMCHEWVGLLRRLSLRALIPPVSRKAAIEYLSTFLAQYVPVDPDTVVSARYKDELCQAWSLETHKIPFDMLTKYLSQQLRVAFIQGVVIVDADQWRVLPDHIVKFMTIVFDPAALSMWPSEYAGGTHRSTGNPVEV